MSVLPDSFLQADCKSSDAPSTCHASTETGRILGCVAPVVHHGCREQELHRSHFIKLLSVNGVGLLPDAFEYKTNRLNNQRCMHET